MNSRPPQCQLDLDIDEPDESTHKLGKAVGEFDTYIRANADRIPNYGERHRAGETISSSFVESAVNQVISKRMAKKQQMRWTPRGACPPAPTDPYPRPQRRTGYRLSPLVSRLRPHR